MHSHRLLHIEPERSAGKHLLGCQKVTAQQININWWQLQIILIIQDKSSQMVSSQLIQTWSCAIIPALVTATSITKVGQTTQRNTHSSNLILISSHIQVRHLKSHQIKSLSMCCHLKNLCTVSQNSSTQQNNKNWAQDGWGGRQGDTQSHRCLCLIWAVCVQSHSTKNSLKIDHRSCLDGKESWERWERRDCQSLNLPTWQSNEKENLSFYLSVSTFFVLGRSSWKDMLMWGTH